VRDETIIKVVAIVSLTVLEVVNMLTMKIDSQVLLVIGAIIGGIAGYEMGRKRYKGSGSSA
jgi:hypothetical protein